MAQDFIALLAAKEWLDKEEAEHGMFTYMNQAMECYATYRRDRDQRIIKVLSEALERMISHHDKQARIDAHAALALAKEAQGE